MKFHCPFCCLFAVSWPSRSAFFCPHLSDSPFALFPPVKSGSIGVHPWLPSFGCGLPLCTHRPSSVSPSGLHVHVFNFPVSEEACLGRPFDKPSFGGKLNLWRAEDLWPSVHGRGPSAWRTGKQAEADSSLQIMVRHKLYEP